MGVIETLKKVQEISLLIEAYEEELERIPADAERMLDDLREKLEEAKKIYHEKELSLKKSEGELEIEKDALKEKESKLNKGGTNPKELKALQDDIEARKKHIRLIEEEVKVAKDELSTIKAKIEEYEQAISKLAERIGGEANRKEELKALLSKKRSELEEALKELPEDARKLFLTLKKIYKHEVVAPVEIVEEGKPKYYCSACSIQLSKSEVDSLKRDKKSLHTCPYCGRIIYFKTKSS
ncbi:MAG: C4-type zinc ribbon domain-containing protein [Actinobacteria bacterium]|nr:C4-type zinc ribbon domain-containing protein [Actinomycetota bacterium]